MIVDKRTFVCRLAKQPKIERHHVQLVIAMPKTRALGKYVRFWYNGLRSVQLSWVDRYGRSWHAWGPIRKYEISDAVRSSIEMTLTVSSVAAQFGGIDKRKSRRIVRVTGDHSRP